MINQQRLLGNRHEITGELQGRWGLLTEDDLASFPGNIQQLVTTIQKKTGEAREDIEQFFEHFTGNREEAISRAGHVVRANQIRAVDSGHESTEIPVHPSASLASFFGIGVLAGTVIAMLIRQW